MSKWAEAVAVSSISATQLATAFLDTCSRLGKPNVLICDRAPSFAGELMKKI